MKKYFFSLIILCGLVFQNSSNASIKIEFPLIPNADCKRLPNFIREIGFNPTTCAFSTSERTRQGVVLIDLSKQNKQQAIYQDPTWKQHGNMGPLAIDENGNAFVAPLPVVNVLTNKREDQNRIYKINHVSGKMELCIDLGVQHVSYETNPYGVVGLFYDCTKKLIYASSVSGSNIEKEVGAIYCIDPNTKPASVISVLKNTDAMGLGVASFNHKPCVFFGSTRNHSIQYCTLNENGSINTDKRNAFSLINQGPRGDDIAKKIRFNQQGEILVTGTPFYYNLTAPTYVQESIYTFSFSVKHQQWKKVKEENKGLSLGYE
jgi:hypothetical protein